VEQSRLVLYTPDKRKKKPLRERELQLWGISPAAGLSKRVSSSPHLERDSEDR